MSFKHLLSTTLLLTTLAACGAGGDSKSVESTNTNNGPQAVSLVAYNSDNIGTVYSADLKGSDSEGNIFTGSLAQANREQIMKGGVLVTPTDAIINLAKSEYSFTVTSTSYTDESGFPVSTVSQTTGVTCEAVSPTKMPDTIKIGDFGIGTAYACSDNSTSSANWRVTDAGGGKVNLVTSTTTRNGWNNITGNSELILTLDSSGKTVGFKASAYDADLDYRIEYESI